MISSTKQNAAHCFVQSSVCSVIEKFRRWRSSKTLLNRTFLDHYNVMDMMWKWKFTFSKQVSFQRPNESILCFEPSANRVVWFLTWVFLHLYIMLYVYAFLILVSFDLLSGNFLCVSNVTTIKNGGFYKITKNLH